MVVFVVFKYVPILNTFWLSLFDYTPISKTFIGFGNFRTILHDAVFFQALLNATILVLSVSALGTILGYALALMFRGGVVGGKLFRTLFFLPVITSIVAISLVFRILYNPAGLGFSSTASCG